MLVLSRKAGEAIQVGGDVRITVLRVRGASVRVGIEAPSYMGIVRGELEFEVDACEDAAEESYANDEA